MKRTIIVIILIVAFLLFLILPALATERFVSFTPNPQAVSLTDQKGTIEADPQDWPAVAIALEALKKDLTKVTGRTDLPITVGTWGKSKALKTAAKVRLADGRKLSAVLDQELKGKREKFVITWTGDRLVIAGSDKRGTVYGIYELSEQMGVSPWWDWADVPVEKREHIYINKSGIYTDGEPAVRYRGIFLNDEAPCLSGWVDANYGGVYNHEFYARVFELVLRLRGNFMWPAMWNAAFYQEDPLNMKTADDMGVIMGTSHHEPMARAHKEWTRQRGRGPWNFDENRQELDTFWLAGVERKKKTEDVVTIGMRGNGDEPMGKNADVALLERVVDSQRQLIEKATGRPAKETPQVWALYKEVQEYYEKGMKVPDDVILLLCDDNWGNVRILPELTATSGKDEVDGVTGASAQAGPNAKKAQGNSPWFHRHPGGYGMYYHVDYVGGPRNSKSLNISQVQRMWEQLQLTYTYGVDKLWILNVGDLKPMELPIDFWFRMAWNPSQFNAHNLMDYLARFCAQQFGQTNAVEAARILNLQCKYAHRRTPESLAYNTYSLAEWERHIEEYEKLEQDAANLRKTLDPAYFDTYDQLINNPINLMGNLHFLHYFVAQNYTLAALGDTTANHWADLAREAFKRDQEICDDYNHRISGGKWNHMMDEVYIGYKSWNGPRFKTMPELFEVTTQGEPVEAAVKRMATMKKPVPANAIHIEASDYIKEQTTNAKEATWQVIPNLGIYADGVALLPYTASTDGASISYSLKRNSDNSESSDNSENSEKSDNLTLTLHLATTFPFNSGRGQRLRVLVDNKEVTTINVNDLEHNIRDAYRDQNYQWETTRENLKRITLPNIDKGQHVLTLQPLDPGIVLERIEVDPAGR